MIEAGQTIKRLRGLTPNQAISRRLDSVLLTLPLHSAALKRRLPRGNTMRDLEIRDLSIADFERNAEENRRVLAAIDAGLT